MFPSLSAYHNDDDGDDDDEDDDDDEEEEEEEDCNWSIPLFSSLSACHIIHHDDDVEEGED